MKFEVFCRYEDFADLLNFYIFSEGENGERYICTSLDKMEFSRYEEGALTDPTLSLKGRIVKPFLKEMANALNKIGIRADGEPVIENELVAVKYHLEDMRKLVFNVKKRQ